MVRCQRLFRAPDFAVCSPCARHRWCFPPYLWGESELLRKKYQSTLIPDPCSFLLTGKLLRGACRLGVFLLEVRGLQAVPALRPQKSWSDVNPAEPALGDIRTLAQHRLCRALSCPWGAILVPISLRGGQEPKQLPREWNCSFPAVLLGKSGHGPLEWLPIHTLAPWLHCKPQTHCAWMCLIKDWRALVDEEVLGCGK